MSTVKKVVSWVLFLGGIYLLLGVVLDIVMYIMAVVNRFSLPSYVVGISITQTVIRGLLGAGAIFASRNIC